MQWTTEKPTKPGLYWKRYSAGDVRPIIVEVSDLSDNGTIMRVDYMGVENTQSLESTEGEWYGPMEPPV